MDIEALRRCLSAQLEKLAMVVGPNEPDGRVIWHLSAPIRDVLSTQPEFSGEPLFLAQLTQTALFGPGEAAARLLSGALRTKDIDAALDRFAGLFAGTKQTFRHFAAIYGIEVPAEGLRVRAITFFPWEQLPLSPAGVQASEMHFAPRPLDLPPATFATIETPPLQILGDSNHNLFEIGAQVAEDVRECTARFSAAANCEPVISGQWSEFSDPILQFIAAGVGWSHPLIEGHVAWTPVPVGEAEAAIVRQTYELDAHRQSIVSLVAQRLNYAKRRGDRADRAVDTAVALEALFGDNTQIEIAYRLKLRAALFLGGDLQARQETKKIIDRLYKLRSRRVHGSTIPDSIDGRPIQAVVTDGVSIARRALQKLISLESPPVWTEWELSGGDPATAKLA